MPFAIREAEPSEEAGVLAMYEWLFAPPGRVPAGWDPVAAGERLRFALHSDRAAVIVAVDGAELVGLCSAYIELVSVRFGLRCWVEDLAVHPDRRSEGIGAALLAYGRDWARERGATHFELDTGLDRTEAQRFYERQGESFKGISYSWPL